MSLCARRKLTSVASIAGVLIACSGNADDRRQDGGAGLTTSAAGTSSAAGAAATSSSAGGTSSVRTARAANAGAAGEATTSACSGGATSSSGSGATSAPGEDDPPSSYCAGQAAWPDDVQLCRDAADCGTLGTWSCQTAPSSGDGCLPTPTDAVTCSTDDDCQDGWSCIERGPFGVACPVGSYCTSPCGALACPNGYECNADTQMCEATPCDAGPTCPDGWACNPGGPDEDARGCTPIPCDAGYDCPTPAICDLGAAADLHGCRLIHCSEPGAPACPINTDCDPNAPGDGCAMRTCVVDTDCDCGTCLNGVCAPRPGVCNPLSTAG